MCRRAFAVAIVMLVLPHSVEAQQSARVPRIGVAGSPTFDEHLWKAFRGGLRDLGHVEGSSIAIEWRGTPGEVDRVRVMTELVGLKPDVIVAPNSAAATAAKRVTSTIPSL